MGILAGYPTLLFACKTWLERKSLDYIEMKA